MEVLGWRDRLVQRLSGSSSDHELPIQGVASHRALVPTVDHASERRGRPVKAVIPSSYGGLASTLEYWSFPSHQSVPFPSIPARPPL